MMRSTSILLATLFTVALSSLLAQDNGASGSVLDATTDGGLPGAAVFLDGQGALTDVDGRFSFSRSGAVVLRVRYVGYIETTHTLDAWTRDRTLDISLEPDVASIGTAVVSAGRYEQDLGEVSVSIDVLPPELVNQGARPVPTKACPAHRA